MPATDGDKRYLLFEGVVLGFCVNPLFRISLVGGFIVVDFLRKLPGWLVVSKHEGKGPPWIVHLCNCANTKVLMKSETRMRTVYSHSCVTIQALQLFPPNQTLQLLIQPTGTLLTKEREYLVKSPRVLVGK